MKIVRNEKLRAIRRQVWSYYEKHGRHDLPWRRTHDPYRILVSEIMLQQTQVSRVSQKYPAFIKRFPNFRALAKARFSDVLVTWQGLGYNRRALYLKKIAERVTLDHGGKLPRDPDILRTFPGIGRNTAGSVAAFAFDIPVPFVETNIRRAFIHNFFSHRTNVSDNEILPLIAATLRLGSGRQGFRARRWYWALMDYGAHLGETLPKIANPNRRSRHYAKQSKFEGSGRQIRGRVLKLLVGRGPLGEDVIRKNINDVRTPSIVQVLVKERFLIRRGSKLRLAD